MKLFTQLALVTAIATSGSAFAMQTMNDSDLSATTGQDGITIKITPPPTGLVIDKAILHDKDGFAGALEGGAIVIGDATGTGVKMNVSTAGAPILVDIDSSGGSNTAGALTGTAPVLNVKVTLPNLSIKTGDISVAGSARSGLVYSATSAATGGTTGTAVKILDSMNIDLGGITLNVQLGNTPQGAMIKLGGTVSGGLGISNIGLVDAGTNGGGTLGVGKLLVQDNAGANLTLDASINVQGTTGTNNANGLVIGLGSASNYKIMLENVTLGSATSTLGDLQVVGLNLTGTTIAISGH